MWLTDFRKQHNLELYELAGLIRIVGAKKIPALTVSEGLIWRLEIDGNFRTVPRLADLIAECCGATAAQRDELVLKKYRGTWKPPKDNRPRLPEKREEKPRYTWGNGRAVVVIDPEGNEIRRHHSANTAGAWVGISGDSVNRRCNRETNCWEFGICKVSFRWADEFDRMTPEERARDAARTKGNRNNGTHAKIPGKRGRGGATYARPVTVITKEREVYHFPSVTAAAKALNVGAKTVSVNLARERPAQAGPVAGIRFMYTRDFEKLVNEELGIRN